MNWFKRTKPIELEFFTTKSHLFSLAKPRQGGAFAPEWWRTLPKATIGAASTMRNCEGIINLFTKGFVLPMGSDLWVKVAPQGSDDFLWQFADRQSYCEDHQKEEFNYYWDPQHYQHLKVTIDWMVRCKEDIKFLMHDAYWWRNTQNIYTIPPGIVDYHHQYGLNVNMFIQKHPTEDVEFTIPFRQPLAHVVPLSDRPLKITHHLVTEFEYNKIGYGRTPVTFNKKHKAVKDAFAAEQCPVHKGLK